MYKVAEVFTSIQGEGKYSGTAATFIRLAMCNLNCDFGGGLKCDDLAHKNPPTIMDWAQLKAGLRPNIRHVVITGGEPTIHPEVAQLIAELKRVGKFVQIETNGFELSRVSKADWITYAPKRGGFVGNEGFDEVKLLVGGNYMPTEEQLTTYFKHIEHKYLSPVNYMDTLNGDSLAKTVNLALQYPDWKISLQIHKILGVR